MFGKHFWQATGERALRTFAQSLVAVLGAAQIGLLDVDWVTTLSTAGMATVLSLLTSVGAAGVGVQGDPSALPAPSDTASTGPGQAAVA